MWRRYECRRNVAEALLAALVGLVPIIILARVNGARLLAQARQTFDSLQLRLTATLAAAAAAAESDVRDDVDDDAC